MKFSAVALTTLLLPSVAHAGFRDRVPAPRGDATVSFTIQDGEYDEITDLDPTFSWRGEQLTDDVALSFGVDTEIQTSTKNVLKWPNMVWGKATTIVGGWGLSAATEFDGDATMEFVADSAEYDLKMRMLASANGDGAAVDGVEASKGFDVGSSTHVVVTPRYDIENSLADVVVGCDINGKTNVEIIASKDAQSIIVQHALMDDTDVKIAASKEYQELTLSQQLDESNRISPTVNSNGEFCLEWDHVVNDESSFTATLKPNDSVDVEWNDGEWTAMIKMPLDGKDIKESAVTIKRDVSF